MMVKSGLDFFYFEIHRAPSEVPVNLPSQFSLSGQQQLWRGSLNVKIKNSGSLFTIFFKSILGFEFLVQLKEFYLIWCDLNKIFFNAKEYIPNCVVCREIIYCIIFDRIRISMDCRIGRLSSFSFSSSEEDPT